MRGASSSVSRDQQTPPLSAILTPPSKRWHPTVQRSSMPKPNCGRKSGFLTTLAFDAPVRGVFVGILPQGLVWKNYNGLATRQSRKVSRMSLLGLTEYTNVTDKQTDTACRHRPRLCIKSRGKNDSVPMSNSLRRSFHVTTTCPTSAASLRRM